MSATSNNTDWTDKVAQEAVLAAIAGNKAALTSDNTYNSSMPSTNYSETPHGRTSFTQSGGSTIDMHPSSEHSHIPDSSASQSRDFNGNHDTMKTGDANENDPVNHDRNLMETSNVHEKGDINEKPDIPEKHDHDALANNRPKTEQNPGQIADGPTMLVWDKPEPQPSTQGQSGHESTLSGATQAIASSKESETTPANGQDLSYQLEKDDQIKANATPNTLNARDLASAVSHEATSDGDTTVNQKTSDGVVGSGGEGSTDEAGATKGASSASAGAVTSDAHKKASNGTSDKTRQAEHGSPPTKPHTLTWDSPASKAPVADKPVANGNSKQKDGSMVGPSAIAGAEQAGTSTSPTSDTRADANHTASETPVLSAKTPAAPMATPPQRKPSTTAPVAATQPATPSKPNGKSATKKSSNPFSKTRGLDSSGNPKPYKHKHIIKALCMHKGAVNPSKVPSTSEKSLVANGTSASTGDAVQPAAGNNRVKIAPEAITREERTYNNAPLATNATVGPDGYHTAMEAQEGEDGGYFTDITKIPPVKPTDVEHEKNDKAQMVKRPSEIMHRIHEGGTGDLVLAFEVKQPPIDESTAESTAVENENASAAKAGTSS